MTRIYLELTLDEVDLVGAAICRDRDRVLDEAVGNSGTRLISDREQAVVPVHQEILRKIDVALNAPSSPLNKALDVIVGASELVGGTGSSPADLSKVRELCEAFSIDALRIAIDVHRASCRQADCPVLAIMLATAESRESAAIQPKHPFNCDCNVCEHFRAEHGS